MLNAKNFYLLASQVPTTLAFLFRYSRTSVGFTLLIDIVVRVASIAALI